MVLSCEAFFEKHPSASIDALLFCCTQRPGNTARGPEVRTSDGVEWRPILHIQAYCPGHEDEHSDNNRPAKDNSAKKYSTRSVPAGHVFLPQRNDACLIVSADVAIGVPLKWIREADGDTSPTAAGSSRLAAETIVSVFACICVLLHIRYV